MNRLPTDSEINPDIECLDGQSARKNFGGKTLDEARNLFAENGLFYAEDLAWMGPVGFMYYFRSALVYLQSKECQDDPDFIGSVLGILESRILGEFQDFDAIKTGALDYIEFCEHLLGNYDFYDIDDTIYGDLRPVSHRLLSHLKAPKT